MLMYKVTHYLGESANDLAVFSNTTLPQVISGAIDSNNVHSYYLNNREHSSAVKQNQLASIEDEEVHALQTSDVFIKWHKDFNVKSHFQTSYSNEVCANVHKQFIARIQNRDKLEEIKIEIKGIESEFRQKYTVIKIIFSTLLFVSESTVDECLETAIHCNKATQANYYSDSRLLYLIRGDLLLITEKIKSAMQKTKDKTVHRKLLDIAYYLTIRFKSLYTLLFLLNQLKELQLEKEYQLPVSEPFEPNLACFENQDLRKITLLAETFDIQFEIEDKEMHFNECSVAFCLDTLFIINKGVLTKYLLLNSKSDCFIKLKSQKLNSNAKKSLCLFGSKLLVSFSYEDYKRNSNVFGLFDLITLEPIDSDIIEYDSQAKELLFSYSVKSPGCYQTLSGECITQDSTIRYSEDNCGICIQGSSIYIILPIKKISEIDKEEKQKYLSAEYIYAIDIFTIAESNNGLMISYRESQVIMNDSPNKGSALLIDEMFNSNESMNKLIIINGLIISGEGIGVYDTKLRSVIKDETKRKVIDFNKEDNSVILSHREGILFLVKEKTEKYISTTLFEAQSYEDCLLYHTNPLYKEVTKIQKEYKAQASKDSSLIDVNSNNYLQDIFASSATAKSNTPSLKSNHETPSVSCLKNKQSNSTSLTLLCALFEYYDLNQVIISQFDITFSLTSPYILSVDFPTMTLFLKLINDPQVTQLELFVYIHLIQYHFVQIINKYSSVFPQFQFNELFFKYIESLFEIKKKNPNVFDRIIGNIIFTILNIIKLSAKDEGKDQEEGIVSKLMEGALESIESLDASYLIVGYFFDYLRDNITSIRHSIQIPKIMEYIKRVMTLLFDCYLNKEKKAFGCIRFRVLVRWFQAFIRDFVSICLLSNISKAQMNDIINYFLTKLNEVIDDHLRENNLNNSAPLRLDSFPFALFCYIVNIVIKKLNVVGKEFILMNWSVLLEIMLKLSRFKSKQMMMSGSVPSDEMYDVIIDNYDLISNKSDSKSIKLSLASLKSSSSFDQKTKLYIEGMHLKHNKQRKKKNNNILTISSIRNAKELFALKQNNNSNVFNRTIQCIECNSNDELRITIDSNERSNLLFKVRVSTYPFYSEDIDCILDHCTDLFYLLLSEFAFFDKRDNEERPQLEKLITKRLFLNGMPIKSITNRVKEYISLFTDSLKGSPAYSLLLMPTLQRELDKIRSLESTTSASVIDNEKILALLNNTKYNNIIESIRESNAINTQEDEGDDTKTNIVKCSFYAVLYHENMLHTLDSYSIGDFQHYLNEVYLLCTKLGGVYQLMKNDNMNTEAILPKLRFLFKLFPEPKQSSNASLEIVKDHIESISSFIQDELLHIEDLCQMFELQHMAIVFRSMSLIILKEIIKQCNENNEEKNKLLANYYQLFIKNILGLPSIYSGLRYPNEDKVDNALTQAFNDLLSEIISQMNTKELSKFTLCTYLNFLQWRLNEYNCIGSCDIKNVVSLLENKTNFLQATRLMFIALTPPDDYCEEMRLIDDHILGQLLSDVFINYTYECIKCKTISNEQKRTSIEIVLASYKTFFTELNQDLDLIETNSNNNKDDGKKTATRRKSFLTYPLTKSTVNDLTDRQIQTKLRKLLFEFNRISIELNNSQHGSIIFNDHKLWKSIVSFLPKTEERSTFLIFSLLKLYSINNKSNHFQLYQLLTEDNEVDRGSYSDELLFEYFYTKSKYNQYAFDYFVYWHFNIDKKIVLDYSSKKIIKDKAIQFISCFGCNVNRLYYYQNIILNRKLCFDEKTKYENSNQTELSDQVLEGYYIKDNSSTLDLTDQIEEEEVDDEERGRNEEERGRNEEERGRNEDEEERGRNEDEEEEEDQQNNHGNDDNKKEAFDDNPRIIQVKDQLILLKQSKQSNSEYLLANFNEIICNNNYSTSSLYLPISKELVQFCFEYLTSSLFNTNTISFQSTLFAIQLIKCLIQSSNQYSDLITSLIEANQASIDKFATDFTPMFTNTILPKEKIEEYFHQSVADLPFKARNEEERINCLLNQRSKLVASKALLKSSPILSLELYNTDQSTKKLYLPLIEYSLPSFTTAIKNILVITIKEYEEIVNDTTDTHMMIKKENLIIVLCRKVVLRLQNEQLQNDDSEKKGDEKDKNNNNNINEDDDLESVDEDKDEEGEGEGKGEGEGEGEGKGEGKAKKNKKQTERSKKKKTKQKTKNLPSEAWIQFIAKLSLKINTLNCYLLIESFEPINIPLTIGWITYQSEYLPTSQLTNSSLLDAIASQYSTPISEAKSSFESFYSTIYHSENSKDNDRNNKAPELVIAVAQKEISKDTDMKPMLELDYGYIDYSHFLDSFPTLSSFKELKPNQLHSVGLFLIQYYLRVLLLSQNKEIKPSAFMLMHCITSYYRDYFNLQFEYNIVHSALIKQIDSFDFNKMIKQKGSRITLVPQIKSEGDFESQCLKQFLLDIIQIYSEKNASDKIHSLLNCIISSKNSQFNKEDIEDPMSALEIANHIIKMHCTKDIIDLLMKSDLMHKVNQIIKDNYIDKASNAARSAIYKINSFLLTTMIAIRSEFKSQDYEIKYNHMNSLYGHFDILSNKASSLALLKELSRTSSGGLIEMKDILDLPITSDSFLIRYHNKASSCLSLSMKNQSNTSMILCGMKSEVTSYHNESNYFILTRHNSDAFLEDCKDIIIIKDNESALLNTMDNRMYKYNHFTDFYPFDSHYDIAKHINGLYYSIKSCKVEKHEVLNELLKTEKLVHIGFNVITTNRAIYMFNDSELHKYKRISVVTKINDKLYKISFPENEIVIGAYLQSGFLCAWTESGKLYGIGNNSHQIIAKNQCALITQYTEIKTLKRSKVVNVISQSSSSIFYQVYDMDSKSMRFFINGEPDTFRILELTDDVFHREIGFLKDKRAIKMLIDNYFFVVYCEGGDIYYRSTYDYGPKGFHKAEAFSQLGLTVCDVTTSKGNGILIDCKRQFDQKKFKYCARLILDKEISFEHPFLLDGNALAKITSEDSNEIRLFKVVYYYIPGVIKCLRTVYKSSIAFPEELVNKKNVALGDKRQMKVIFFDHKNKERYDITLANCINDKNKGVLLWFDVLLNEESDSDKHKIKDKDNDHDAMKQNAKDDKQLYTFINKSTLITQNHPEIIQLLYQFSKVFKSIKQLGVYVKALGDKELKSSSVVYRYDTEPNTSPALTITPRLNEDELFRTEDKQINSITDGDILKYKAEKEAYERNKPSIKVSFHDYLMKKYQKPINKQHYSSLFSSIDCLSLLEAINQIIDNAGTVFRSHFPFKEGNWISNFLMSNSPFINADIKENCLKEGLNRLQRNSKRILIVINREIALRNKSKRERDQYYQWSVFSQLYYSKKLEEYFTSLKQKEKKLIKVIGINENNQFASTKVSIHKIIGEAFNELASPILDLFKIDKEKAEEYYSINPLAKSAQHLELFAFIGKLFAFLIINEKSTPLQLDPLIWNQILHSMRDGNNDTVNVYHQQIKAIQNGLFSLIDRKMLVFFTWEEFESKICRSRPLDVNRLKRNTIYEGYTSRDKTIQFFWTFLRSSSREYQTLYCKFVRGKRSVMLKKGRFCLDYHVIKKNSEGSGLLPLGNPSQFLLLLPEYSSYEELKDDMCFVLVNNIKANC